jgi:hypothetical protein
MRVVEALFAVSLTALAASIAVISCESTSSPGGAPDGGSITPMLDGAVCACATPDCLPGCSDLPACKLTCISGEGEEGGATREWIDPCGNSDYAQTCPNGCADAATLCQ